MGCQTPARTGLPPVCRHRRSPGERRDRNLCAYMFPSITICSNEDNKHHTRFSEASQALSKSPNSSSAPSSSIEAASEGEDTFAKTVEPGGGGGASIAPPGPTFETLFAAVFSTRLGEFFLINLVFTTIFAPSLREKSPRSLVNKPYDTLICLKTR